MKKLLRFSALCMMLLLFKMQHTYAQTVVYSNSFPGVDGLPPFPPSGSPLIPFMVMAGSTDATMGSAAGIQVGGPFGTMLDLTDNQLAAAVSVATVTGTTNNGFAAATASVAGYLAPFNPTLSLNDELLTWTFNIRTSLPATGFADGQNNAAVVLAGTDPNIRMMGNGYAVTFNPALPLGLQLVRYSGGLTGTVTTLVASGAALTGPTNYASVKVIYESTIDQWTLYIRDDGAGAFADPSTGVSVAVGSTIDATLTATPMTTFGFLGNYSVTYAGLGPDAQSAYFDQFSLTSSCPEITGGSSTCIGLTLALSNPLTGGVWTSGTPSVATVGAATGLVTGIASGTTIITYTSGSCEVTEVVTVNPLPLAPPITGTLSVCMGETTTLSALPAVAGSTWSSTVTAVATVNPATGVVSGITAGTTIISYRLPSGCFSTAIVTVNPVAPISGFPTMCEGDVYTFVNTVPGGTWSSSDMAVGTVDIATGEVTAISPGTADITYTFPSSCFVTITITVNTNPTPITGIFSVCEGLSTTLSSGGPVDGFWASSNETVATITDAGLFIGNSAGTALITYRLTTGCLVTQEVTVNAQPGSIGGTLSVCQEATTTLTNALAGGAWTSSAPAIGSINAATGVLTGILPGTSVVTYMMPSGCFRSAIATVNPTPTPILGTPSVCVGFTTALTSLYPGGAWASSDLAVGTVSATGVVAGISSGTTTISYSLGTGCRRTAIVTVSPLPPAITGALTVCEGSTTDLNNTSAGGTWSSSVSTVGTIDAATGVVAGLTAGTTTILYTIGTGCSATAVVTVLVTPAAITGTAAVCLGQTTTLSNTTPLGTWSSSNAGIASVNAAGVVTGNIANTAIISYTTANGCSATLAVTVNNLPGVITGAGAVCVNANITLSATPLPLVGAWSSSDMAVGTISAAGVLNGLTAGTTTITYTSLGCDRTRVITVNALPGTITGTPTVCLGLTTTLNSTPAGGTWTSSDIVDAPVGAATGIVTGNGVGTANITYTISTGCIRTRTITVNSLPAAIGGPGTLCPATTITLTNTSAGGTWQSGTPAVATIGLGTGIVTGIANGTAIITYTLPTTCISTTIVTVSPAPPSTITPIGDTILCPGDFVTLTASTTPGVTYQWFVGGSPISGAVSATLIASTTGSYQVRVSATAGCSLLSPPQTVTILPAVATITLPGGSATTCAGTPVALNANTGVGLTYQWELAGTAITGATNSVYNATASGSYRVRVINSAGCWAVSAPEVIIVNPTPLNVVTASGPITFCNGANVTLTAASGTGYSYQWFNTAGAISGATGASFTATTAESYYAEVTNSFGCTTTTLTTIVNVNPLPDVTVTVGGPLLFCAGGSVLLTSVPGFAYQWYRGAVAIPGANSLGYVANVSGGYRVRVTDLLTGCSDMTHADTVVTVVAAPTVLTLTPAKFCWGGSSLLSTSASTLGSAITYQWFFNSAAIVGATSPTYSATAAGLYSCQISVPSSCTIATSTVSVNEMPLPDPPIAISGASMRTATIYVSYQWYKNLSPIAGATAYSTPITGNGNYKVAVTDTNGCQSVSAVYVLTDWKGGGTTGVTELSNTIISIYPNPATETVFIEAGINVRAIVSSIDGKVLIDKENAKEISIRNLADGLYLITLFDNNGQQVKVQKLVKKQ
jgi:uncharacterized protein YjdB